MFCRSHEGVCGATKDIRKMCILEGAKDSNLFSPSTINEQHCNYTQQSSQGQNLYLGKHIKQVKTSCVMSEQL
jgi:hypothetical protein